MLFSEAGNKLYAAYMAILEGEDEGESGIVYGGTEFPEGDMSVEELKASIKALFSIPDRVKIIILLNVMNLNGGK